MAEYHDYVEIMGQQCEVHGNVDEHVFAEIVGLMKQQKEQFASNIDGNKTVYYLIANTGADLPYKPQADHNTTYYIRRPYQNYFTISAS